MVFLAALVCIMFVEGLSFAATPRSGRFLDRFLRSTEDYSRTHLCAGATATDNI